MQAGIIRDDFLYSEIKDRIQIFKYFDRRKDAFRIAISVLCEKVILLLKINLSRIGSPQNQRWMVY
jgi:hypothetical protein